MITDPLNLVQRLPYDGVNLAGGRQHFIYPRANVGSLINGHSIEHVIEALSPTGGTWDTIKNILRSATTPKF